MTSSQTTEIAVQALAPLNIDIGGPGSRPYKSIGDLAWHDIPSFAVLTGLNGSGAGSGGLSDDVEQTRWVATYGWLR